MTAANTLLNALSPVVDFLYPPRCPLCGEGIDQQSGLCVECWSGLVIPGEPSCETCQRPLPFVQKEDAMRCAPCLATLPEHAGISAATLYNDSSRRLILTLKYGRKIALAKMMAQLMAAKLPKDPSNYLLVPVPLHRWRIWQRGFNQAALLAQELGKICGAPVLLDALERRKATPPLGGLGKPARTRALAGAITVHPKRRGRLQNLDVILVDDVLTSGATSSTCVKVLRSAGASSVRIACFARVLDEALSQNGENETPEIHRTPGAA